jgi:hypothetical protein
MNWFAGTNGSHRRDQASQQEKVWRDPAEEARVGRDLFLDDRIEDRPILVERHPVVGPSIVRAIAYPGPDRSGEQQPHLERLQGAQSATIYLGGLIAREAASRS